MSFAFTISKASEIGQTCNLLSYLLDFSRNSKLFFAPQISDLDRVSKRAGIVVLYVVKE